MPSGALAHSGATHETNTVVELEPVWDGTPGLGGCTFCRETKVVILDPKVALTGLDSSTVKVASVAEYPLTLYTVTAMVFEI